MAIQVEKIHTCSGHRAALYALAPGRTHRHFLTAGGDGWVVEWDLDEPETGKLVAAVETQVFSLAALPDTNRLVAGNMQGGLHWISRDAPDQTRNLQHHRKSVHDLLPLGSWLFSAGGDGLLTRWDTRFTRSVESIQLSHQALRCIVYNEKRGLLAVGASDKSIYLLDAETLDIQRVIKDAHTNSVFTLAFTPDGSRLLSGGRDAMLRIWDLDQDLVMESAQAAHWYTLNHLVFSPDGAFFASASRDKTLKIWDGQTFELLKVVDTLRLGSHARSVNRLLWNSEALISCSDDGQAMIWQVTAQ